LKKVEKKGGNDPLRRGRAEKLCGGGSVSLRRVGGGFFARASKLWGQERAERE